MMNKTLDIRRHSLSTAERYERIGLALLLAFGAVLMLVASGASGEDRLPFSASRTDRFNATLGSRATVRIENVSGDIVASAGKNFSAVATISINAATQKRADEMLSRTVVEQTQDEDGYTLETRWPDSSSRSGRGHRYTSIRPSDARITVKFEVTVPAGVTAVLKTVNGEVRVTDVDGELEVSSVNGDVRVSGTRRSFKARTVNGRVEAVGRAAAGRRLRRLPDGQRRRDADPAEGREVRSVRFHHERRHRIHVCAARADGHGGSAGEGASRERQE